jgi:hypothetical protein
LSNSIPKIRDISKDDISDTILMFSWISILKLMELDLH